MVPSNCKICPVTCSRVDALDFSSEMSSSVRSCEARMRRRCSKTMLSVSSAMMSLFTHWQSVSLQRLGPGDDLDQLLGNRRLTGPVVGQGLLADHVARVARGVVHGDHLGAVKRGHVLHQGAENLHRDV